MRRTTWNFPEEKKVCGMTGLQFNKFRWHHRAEPDISNVLVAQPVDHPWFIIIWEPLTTHAPNPCIAAPYCCYINTVIFYHRPYTIDQFARFWNCNGRLKVTNAGKRFLQYDQIETAICSDDELLWNGETFVVGGGRVVWQNKRWWMQRWARRKD